MPLPHRLAAAVSASFMICASSAAFAQQPGPQGGADLRAALHIRPDQEAVYAAYQSAGPQPNELAQLRSGANMATMTTPQRLDRIGVVLGIERTVFHRKADATLALYRALNPDQQHTFDQITAPPSRGGSPGASPPRN